MSGQNKVQAMWTFVCTFSIPEPYTSSMFVSFLYITARWAQLSWTASAKYWMLQLWTICRLEDQIDCREYQLLAYNIWSHFQRSEFATAVGFFLNLEDLLGPISVWFCCAESISFFTTNFSSIFSPFFFLSSPTFQADLWDESHLFKVCRHQLVVCEETNDVPGKFLGGHLWVHWWEETRLYADYELGVLVTALNSVSTE